MSTTGQPWRSLGLDLVSLRILVAAAEEGTLAKAAERENIALSAVSRRISDMESRAGVQFLARSDRGVSPTPAGERLIGQLRDVFGLLDQIGLELEAIRKGARGHVRIHAHMSAMTGELPRRLAGFLGSNPEIDVEINEETSVEVLHAVKVGIADVGLVSGTVDGEGLQLIPWGQDRLLAVLPEGHPLARRSTLAFAELLDHPFVGMQRDSALLALYRSQAAALGRPLRERAHATSFESVRHFVAFGLGVSILPSGASEPFRNTMGIEVRPLSDGWAQRPLMLCVKDLDRTSVAARLLIDHLKETAS